MIDELDRVYLAGLFDGDGCVSITCEYQEGRSTTYQLHVVFTQGEKHQLLWLRDLWDMGSVHLMSHGRGYHWRLSASNAERLLRAIHPYCKIKRDQVEIALQFRETYLKKNRPKLSADTLVLREKLRKLLQESKRKI